MSTNENHIRKTIFMRVKRNTMWANTLLLLCHVLFLWSFYKMGVMFMFYLNFISIATYLFTYWLSQKKKTILYVIVTFSELYIHMFFSVLCVGWDFGFQQYCYTLIPATLFTDYLINKDLKLRKSTVVIVGIYIITYIALRIWTMNHAPFYEESTVYSELFYIPNALLTLTFLTIYSVFFGNTAYRQERALTVQAEQDALTGLRNRRYMQKLLDQYTQHFTDDIELYLAIMDIDFFKKINDTYGHDAGDTVLKSLAEILKKQEQSTKDFYTGRWGGEEFVFVYVPESDFHPEFSAILEEIHKSVEKNEFVFNNHSLHCTVTIGAAKHRASRDVEETLNYADQMLYLGKNSSRNCIKYFTEKDIV